MWTKQNVAGIRDEVDFPFFLFFLFFFFMQVSEGNQIYCVTVKIWRTEGENSRTQVHLCVPMKITVAVMLNNTSL